MKLTTAASFALLFSQLSAAYLCDGTVYHVGWAANTSGTTPPYLSEATGIVSYEITDIGTSGRYHQLKFVTRGATMVTYTFWPAFGDQESNTVAFDGAHYELYTSTGGAIAELKCK